MAGKEVRVNVVNDMGRQITPTSIAGTRFYKMWLKFPYVINGGNFNFAKQHGYSVMMMMIIMMMIIMIIRQRHEI
jgi:hypothetical protein